MRQDRVEGLTAETGTCVGVVGRNGAGKSTLFNIITKIPTMVTMEVMNCVKLCCSVLPMVSMSLVVRLKVSPFGRPSKYFSGSFSSFLLTSWRRS